MELKLLPNHYSKNYTFKAVDSSVHPDSYYKNPELSTIPLHQDENDSIFFFLPAVISDESLYFKVYINVVDLNPSLSNQYSYYNYFGDNQLYIPAAKTMTIISGVSKEFVNQYKNHFLRPMNQVASSIDLNKELIQDGTLHSTPINADIPVAQQEAYIHLYAESEKVCHPLSPNLALSRYLSMTSTKAYSSESSINPVFSFETFFIFNTSENDMILQSLLEEIFSSTSKNKELNNTVCSYCTFDNEDATFVSDNYKFANSISGYVHCSHPFQKDDFAPCVFYNRESSCPVYREKTEQISSNTIILNSDDSFNINLLKITTKNDSNYYKIFNDQTQDYTHSFVVPENDEEGNPVDHLEHALNVYNEVLSSYEFQESQEQETDNTPSYILSLVGKND